MASKKLTVVYLLTINAGCPAFIVNKYTKAFFILPLVR
jgi:hypothetical protein